MGASLLRDRAEAKVLGKSAEGISGNFAASSDVGRLAAAKGLF